MRDPKFNQTDYEAASITVVTGQTNRDIKANETALFSKGKASNHTVISTDQTITIRLNDSTYGAIVMTSTESPKVFDAVGIQNMFITNASGATANIKIELYS